MSVLLIEPRCPSRFAKSPDDFTSLVNRQVNLIPPLSLAYLAAFLKKADIPVFGLDLNLSANASMDFLKKVEEIEPKIIGISANFTSNINQTLVLNELVKKSYPEIITVFGGHHANFCAEEILAAGVDVVVLGEGEITFLELARAILQSGKSWARNLDKISGLAFKDGDKIIFTPKRPATENLDELPFPALEIFPDKKYGINKIYPLITSRGCQMNCYFCAVAAFCGGRLRIRSAANIREEIQQAIQKGYINFTFSDDNFSFSQERVREICEAVKDLEIKWTANCHIKNLNQELLELMKASGCHQIRIGVESGAAAVISKIKQGLTKEKVLELAAAAQAAGLDITAGFMFPHYLDTPATADETTEFIKQLGRTGIMVTLSMTTPLPGTTLFEKPDLFNIKIFEKNWDKFNFLTPVFETPHFNRRQIEEKFHQMENVVIEITVENVLKILKQNQLIENLPVGQEFITQMVKDILKH